MYITWSGATKKRLSGDVWPAPACSQPPYALRSVNALRHSAHAGLRLHVPQPGSMPYFQLHASPIPHMLPAPTYFAPYAHGLRVCLVWRGSCRPSASAGYVISSPVRISCTGYTFRLQQGISPSATHSGYVRHQRRWLHTFTALRAPGGFATPEASRPGRACVCMAVGSVGVQ